MRLIVLCIIFVVMLIASVQPQAKEIVEAAKAKLSDPREVVAATCAPAASPLCRCIVEQTVETLQAAPREMIALFEQPDAVWDDLLNTFDAQTRQRAEAAKAQAESQCRVRTGATQRPIPTMERLVRAESESRTKRSLRGACAADGATSQACACYEQTLESALSPEDFEVVRKDARFPPLLEDMVPERRSAALATMAAARSACGVGGG